MRAGLAFVAALLAGPSVAQGTGDILAAELKRPTPRYAHAVLGDALEWGALELTVTAGSQGGVADRRRILFVLPERRVFEDIEARETDADGDGRPEVIVVETDVERGAALAIYGPEGLRAITPFLGAPNRWLAPAGVGDFDNDGQTEIAWVERPHADRVLVIGRLTGNRIARLAQAPGFSNHRIGETAITGTVANCPDGDRLLLPDAGWTQWQEVRLQNGRIVRKDAGPITATPAACDG